MKKIITEKSIMDFGKHVRSDAISQNIILYYVVFEQTSEGITD